MAVQKNGDLYGIKAISSEGELNDVKGIKMMKEDVEMEMGKVRIYAHIKALPQ